MPSSRPLVLLVAFLLLSIASIASAQSEPAAYVRRNSFGVLFAYSNDSSHILFGQAEQRKLLNIGVSYSRKLIAGRIVNFQFDAEFLPVALESDPLSRGVIMQTSPTKVTTIVDGGPPISCAPISFPFSYVQKGVTYSGTVSYTCHGRQWTMGTAMAPAGLQWNFLPRHRLQPFLTSHGGYMFSAQEHPNRGRRRIQLHRRCRRGTRIFPHPRPIHPRPVALSPHLQSRHRLCEPRHR